MNHHLSNTTTTSGSTINENGKRPSSSSLSPVVVVAAGAAPSSSTSTTTTAMPSQPPPPPSSSSLSSRMDKKGAPLTEQKLRRLEKNRLSARECRRRKREATEQTQRHINLLEGENLRLRLQLQVGEEAEVSTQDEQQRLTQVLDDLLKSGASEAEIYTKIEEYKEKFADYGRDRRSAIEFHLRNIERLLMPTQTTSVVLTTLHMGNTSVETMTTTTRCNRNSSDEAEALVLEQHQPTAAATLSSDTLSGVVPVSATSSSSHIATTTNKNNTLDAKTLFRQLVEILQVTPEQAAALKDSRFVAREMDECLKTSLGVLEELRRRLAQCGEDLEHEFDNVRTILTPTQAARFLVWVANNKACMHMLNELWNRVYPQQQQQQQHILLQQQQQQDELMSSSSLVTSSPNHDNEALPDDASP